MNIGCSWSGGKDSCLALMRALENGHEVKAIVNMMNENGRISRSHGLPLSLLEQQAAALEVSLVTQPTSWNDYQANFIQTLNSIRQEFSIDAMVFGDIDLQEHRDWEEMVCSKANLGAMLPIWKEDRAMLVEEMLNAGMDMMIVSCNTLMGEKFLGQRLSKKLVKQLKDLGVDVCGENGEFHTVVVSCPLFKNPVELPGYSTVLHDNYWFLQWEL